MGLVQIFCINPYLTCIYLSCSRWNATSNAVLLSPADLWRFHASADYIFTLRITGAVFFFRHWLAALLSLKEIVVGGLPCSYEFRAFPAKHPLFSALRTYVFGRSLFLFIRHWYVFVSPYAILTFFLLSHLGQMPQLILSDYCLGVRLLGIKSN